MNYNPQNEQGLLGLITALKSGLDPNTAYSVYQNIQSDQANDIAQRQQRLGGLADLLMGAAGQGATYQGAQALAQAAPGPAGPAVQNMLSALYPTGQDPTAGMTNANGQVLDIARPGRSELEYGSASPSSAIGQSLQYGAGPQATSPAFQPPQPSVGEQVQQQQLLAQQQLEPLWQEFSQNASIAAQQGKTREQFMQEAARVYPELFGADIQTVQQIVLSVFPQTVG